MALTVNYIPRYKGLVSSHPQLQDSSASDDGSIQTTQGRALKVSIATTTYPVTGTDDVVVCNATADFVLTLPASAGLGRRIILKNINQGVAQVTPTGSDSIDGSVAVHLLGKFGSCILVDYVAGKWIVIN